MKLPPSRRETRRRNYWRFAVAALAVTVIALAIPTCRVAIEANDYIDRCMDNLHGNYIQDDQEREAYCATRRKAP